MDDKKTGHYQQVFRYRSFRYFWIGFSFSELGDTMTRVALTWFVYETTNSAQALGWLTVFYTGPVIGGGLLAGWLLDRFGRQKVMLVDSLLRATIVMGIPVLHSWGHLALWHIYLVAAVYGLLMMIPLAGGPALVSTLIPKQYLATANALETLSFTLGGVIGPPLAGFLIPWFGAPNVLILDVISYLTFALLLTQGKPAVETPPQASSAGQTYRMCDAFQLLWYNPVIFATTFMFMAFNVGFGAMAVWLPLFTTQILEGGSAFYGTLLGLRAIGEVVSYLLRGVWFSLSRWGF
jgi:MFS family permease